MEDDRGNLPLDKIEKMIRTREPEFMDLDEFESVVNHYIERMDLKKAQTALDCAFEIYPESHNLKLIQAQLLVMQRRPKQALETITDIPDFDTGIIIEKSLIFTKCNCPDLAIDLLNSIIVDEHTNSDLFFVLGSAYQQKEEYAKAVKYYKRSLEIDVENDISLFEMIYCLESIDRLEEAIPFFQQLIDKNPYSHHAWYNLGNIYSQLAQPEKAIDAFEYATAIKPDFASGYFNMGNCYYFREKYNEAVDNFEQCLEHEQPSAELYVKIGDCYEKMDSYDLAFEHYKNALKLDSSKEQALVGIGSILYERNKPKEAIHYIKKALESNQFSAYYWHLLANSEYKLGNEANCLEAFEKALEFDPLNPDIWKDYAFIFYDQQEYASALEIMKEGLKTLPEAADLYYLAFVYAIKDGQYKEALSLLETAVIIDKTRQHIVFEYFSELEEQKAIIQLIDKLS